MEGGGSCCWFTLAGLIINQFKNSTTDVGALKIPEKLDEACEPELDLNPASLQPAARRTNVKFGDTSNAFSPIKKQLSANKQAAPFGTGGVGAIHA